MPFPNQDYSKRDCELPAGCKDLADAISREQATASLAAPEAPISYYVGLPEIVSVKYVAELAGQDLQSIVAIMRELRINVSVERSISFEDAAKILRRYGIAARRMA